MNLARTNRPITTVTIKGSASAQSNVQFDLHKFTSAVFGRFVEICAPKVDKSTHRIDTMCDGGARCCIH